MDIQTDFNPQASLLVLSGAAGPAFVRSLHEAALRVATAELPAVLHCSELERLDASCLQVLVALHIALKNSGHTLTVSGATDKVLETVRRAGAGFLLEGMNTEVEQNAEIEQSVE